MTSDAKNRPNTAQTRIRLVCDGTPVVIECQHERWVVADEQALRAELTVLRGLGGGSRAIDRALGVCGALNACLIYPDEATSLNKQLAALEERQTKRFRHSDVERRIAITQACAWLNTEGAWRWLLWMLPKRLERSLRRTPWVVPGWHGWQENIATYWDGDGNFAKWLDDEFWDRLEDHPDERFIQLSVATDPQADPALLSMLAGSVHREINDLVATNPSTPADALESLARVRARNWTPLALVGLRVLQNSKVPPRLLETVAMEEVARRADFDDDDVALAYIRWAVSHPKAPSRLLAKIERELTTGGTAREAIRANIADHPKASARLLLRMSTDASPRVRAAVARNPKASAQLLGRLANDRNRRVRAAAADHSAVSPELLATLAHDAVPMVRSSVAHNGATPRSTLDLLTADNTGWVAAAAAANPGTSASAATAAQRRLIDAGDVLAQYAVYSRENTDADLLVELSQHPDEYMRFCVAGHPNTPQRAFEHLMNRALECDDKELLEELMDNPALPQAERTRGASVWGPMQPRPPRRMTAEARKRLAARKKQQTDLRA